MEAVKEGSGGKPHVQHFLTDVERRLSKAKQLLLRMGYKLRS